MNAGIVVSTSSSLAQFQVVRYADGETDKTLPVIVWVDGASPLKPYREGIGCGCSGPFYPIRCLPDGVEVTCPFPGYTPSVCACMGTFIE